MNMIFPKDKAKLISILKEACINNDYDLIKQNQDEIIFFVLDLLTHSKNLISDILLLCFKKNNYDFIIELVNQINKKGQETFEWDCFLFASLLANNDLNYAKSIIDKSKLLNDDAVSYYYLSDERSYHDIVFFSNDILKEAGLCLIFVNMIIDIIDECRGKTISREYIITRYFDVINLINEIKQDSILINELIDFGETIFNIPIF